MKKTYFFMVIALLIVAAPTQRCFAQLSKVWEEKRNFHLSDAGQLVEAYHDPAAGADYIITVALINYYSAMNVTKRDESGLVIWSKNIVMDEFSYWQPMELLVDQDGNAIIAGQVYNSVELRYELFITKINSSGATEWAKTYSDETTYFYLSGFEINATGTHYFLGTSYIEYLPSGDFISTIEIFRIKASNGSLTGVEETELENRYAITSAMVSDPTGIYLTGYTSNDDNGYDILTLKYNPSGDLAWMRTYGSDEPFAYGVGEDIAINNEGKIVVAGQIDYQNLVALGYSADGSLDFVFNRDFGANAYVYNTHIEDADNSETYVASQVNKVTGSSIYLTQLSDFGDMVWEKFLDDDYLTTMKLSPTGESVWLLSSIYSLDINNYLSRLSGVIESGELVSSLFKHYRGYNAVMDFATPDGISFYLEGNVRETETIYLTDELTARWDVVPERLSSNVNTSVPVAYPNPCSDYTIVYPGNTENAISVFDESGKLMVDYNDIPDGFQMNTDQWPAGIYLLKISTQEGQQVEKLVKE